MVNVPTGGRKKKLKESTDENGGHDRDPQSRGRRHEQDDE